MEMKGVGESWNATRQWSGDQIGVLLAGLQDADLLRWLDSITNASANVYDKAMDKLYLETHVGGANHRLFDDGHTLSAAWERVKDAQPDDSTRQEIAGYLGGVWNDMTTVKGLPFVTLRPE
ncbi:hypothetical protein GF324_13525 [bacterium]|nr:hypothetical protein [bacterium]